MSPWIIQIQIRYGRHTSGRETTQEHWFIVFVEGVGTHYSSSPLLPHFMRYWGDDQYTAMAKNRFAQNDCIVREVSFFNRLPAVGLLSHHSIGRSLVFWDRGGFLWDVAAVVGASGRGWAQQSRVHHDRKNTEGHVAGRKNSNDLQYEKDPICTQWTFSRSCMVQKIRDIPWRCGRWDSWQRGK